MVEADKHQPEEQVELAMGNLLRGGVLLSATLVLLGAIIYLYRHGTEPAEHRVFRGEPAELRQVSAIVEDAWAFRGRSLIQLGLLVLIATPVARVTFTFFAFLHQRDYAYVLVTLIVLSILLYGLFGRHP
jgi:uncharacterized membrane protein